jgi:hypothetical protein
MSKDYNGWNGYPTWAVALWLGNEPATDEATRRLVAEWCERTREDGGTLSELADELRAYVEGLPAIEGVTEVASLASDLLGFALDFVDWHEIAEHYAADELGPGVGRELERRRALALAASYCAHSSSGLVP